MAVGPALRRALVLAAMATAHSDTFWQLRAGEDIWRTGRVTYLDSYSYTARGAAWPDHEWLTEALFYAAYRIGGMPLLAALCAAAILIAYALSWRLTGDRFEANFMLFALGLSGAVGGWSMRPQVISMACFMLTCTLIARDRVWWLPPLFLVWAERSRWRRIGDHCRRRDVGDRSDRPTSRPVRLSLACALSVAATLATPMGFGLWPLLAAYGQREKTRGILEWMAPTVSTDYFAFWLFRRFSSEACCFDTNNSTSARAGLPRSLWRRCCWRWAPREMSPCSCSLRFRSSLGSSLDKPLHRVLRRRTRTW